MFVILFYMLYSGQSVRLISSSDNMYTLLSTYMYIPVSLEVTENFTPSSFKIDASN